MKLLSWFKITLQSWLQTRVRFYDVMKLIKKFFFSLLHCSHLKTWNFTSDSVRNHGGENLGLVRLWFQKKSVYISFLNVHNFKSKLDLSLIAKFLVYFTFFRFYLFGRKIGQLMLLFWCHSLIKLRSPPLTVSDQLELIS